MPHPASPGPSRRCQGMGPHPEVRDQSDTPAADLRALQPCTFLPHGLRGQSELSPPCCASLSCPSDWSHHTLLTPPQTNPPPGTHPIPGARLWGLLRVWLQRRLCLHLLGVTEQGDMGWEGGQGWPGMPGAGPHPKEQPPALGIVVLLRENLAEAGEDPEAVPGG